MFEATAGNILAWAAQAIIIAAVGAVLPMALRIRHPRTQAVYCQAILLACLLLPAIEPWRHPIVTASAAREAEPSSSGSRPRLISAPNPRLPRLPAEGATPQGPAEPPAPAAQPMLLWTQLPWSQWVVWLMALGAVVRLGWLFAGLWAARRLRIESMPLYPVPESIRAAGAVTHSDAVFCLSAEVTSPVMLGWLSPVVLLPESFSQLGEEAQCGIACHELLHVRRHDWLVTMAEEIVGALFWFNPGAWLLLAQARLAREQIVDQEVVRLTAAPEPYIAALLSIARGGLLDPAPVPLFLRKRHLTQRVHLLLKEVSMSKRRLVASYGAGTAMLGVAAWLAFTSFPLIGGAQTVNSNSAPPAATAEATPTAPPFIRQRASSTPAQATPTAAIGVGTNPTPAPVPADPRELVTGGATTPATPADRAAALALFERAEQNSKLHLPGTPPFALKATLFAGGNGDYAGSGELTESWQSGQAWRWTAKLGGYSQVRIGSGNRGFDEKPVAIVPLRVQMLREAIFWAVRPTPSNARIRTAAAQWNGAPVTCLLVSRVTQPRMSGRLWEEQEYCIDNATALLRIYSEAPGVYVVYDYERVPFHGTLQPRQITIYAARAAVLDAQISVTDLGSADPRLFQPTPEMTNAGLGLALRYARAAADLTNPLASGTLHSVMLHITVDGQGKLLEQEVAAASDPALAKPALDFLRGGKYRIMPSPGAQGEMYINVRFHPAPAGWSPSIR